eukprot:scaffold35986_cov58-Phaeocystis_antarctica.AAC.1
MFATQCGPRGAVLQEPTPLNGLCQAAAPGRFTGDPGFLRRSRVQRRSPLPVRGRLLELRRRARPRLPSTTTLPAQHRSPHLVGLQIIRRIPHNPRRQRLEPLVAPPLRLDHLGALLPCQHVECPCRGPCPALRARLIALLGLEVPLCSLHFVPRVGERSTEVVVRRGLVRVQGDGLAVGPGGSACILLREVSPALGQ